VKFSSIDVVEFDDDRLQSALRTQINCVLDRPDPSLVRAAALCVPFCFTLPRTVSWLLMCEVLRRGLTARPCTSTKTMTAAG
jgi:hypothetical protein